MISTFKRLWICDKCDSKFVDMPKEVCPVCLEVSELKVLIENMKTEADYREIKRRAGKMEDSIPKFDIYNYTNRQRKTLFDF